MKISLDAAMLNDEPLSALPVAVAEAGYSYVELANRPDLIPAFAPCDTPMSTVREFRTQLADAGLTLSSVAIIQQWSRPEESTRTAAVDAWRRGLEIAAELGCQHLNTELRGDPNRPQESHAAWLRSLDDLDQDLTSGGFTLSVEPHPYDFEERLEPTLAIIRGAERPYLRYLHCVPHTFYLGATTTEALAAAGPLVDHVHLADTLRPERIIANPEDADVRLHQHLDIGQGEVDWTDVFDGLARSGFDGILTSQVFAWPDRARESFARNLHQITSRLHGGSDPTSEQQ